MLQQVLELLLARTYAASCFQVDEDTLCMARSCEASFSFNRVSDPVSAAGCYQSKSHIRCTCTRLLFISVGAFLLTA
eukprot:6221617-Amphidinium_carterae.1